MGNQTASPEIFSQTMIYASLIAPTQPPLTQHLQRLEQQLHLFNIHIKSPPEVLTVVVNEILAQIDKIVSQDTHAYFNQFSDVTNERLLSKTIIHGLFMLVKTLIKQGKNKQINQGQNLAGCYKLLNYAMWGQAEFSLCPQQRWLVPDLQLTITLMQTGLLMHNQMPWLLSSFSQLALKLIADKELVERYHDQSDYYKQFTEELGLDHESSNNKVIPLSEEKAIQLFWARTIHSHEDFQLAIIASVLALGQHCISKQVVKKQALQSVNFMPQIIQLIKSSNDEQVVVLLMQVIEYRLQSSKFADQDLHYFFVSQITQNEDESFVADESFLLEAARQVLQLSDDGPLRPSIVRSYKVQVRLFRLLNLSLRVQSNSISRSPKCKFFKQRWHAMQMEALTNDCHGNVLKHQFAFIQRIVSFEKNQFGEVESQQLLQQVEYLLNIWTQRLGQKILNADGSEITTDQKVYLITVLLRFFVNKSHLQRETEWGARTLEHKIVDIVLRQTMPQLQQSNLDSILFSLIGLLSEMIENEPNLIKVLYQNEIISMLITLLQTLQYDFSAPKIALPPYHDYFKILTKFLGRLVLTQQGQATVEEHGVSLLKQILDQQVNLKPYDSEFFEIDVARQRLFQIQPVRDLIRTFIIQQIENSQLAASQYSIKYQQVFEKTQSKQITNFLMQEDQALLQANLRCLHFKDQRLKRQHDLRPQQANLEPILTQLINESSDPVLEHRSDLIKLIETLVCIDQPVANLISIVKTLINETPSAPEGELSKNVKYIEQTIKSSIHDFAKSTDLMQLSDLDSIPRTQLHKLLLYTQNQLITKERDQIKNWSSEIPILLQIARLVCQKWFNITIQIVFDPQQLQNYKKLKKALQVTDLQSYVALVKSLEQTHLTIRKQAIQEFGIQTFDSDDFPFFMLHSINRLDERMRDQPLPQERNFENKSLLTFGEELANLASQLLTQSTDDLLQWCSSNEPVIQVLSVFTLNDRMYGQLHIGFVYRNGLVPLCRLYKELNKVQHLMVDASDPKQVLTQAIIWAQKEGIAKIILAFVHLKEKRRYQLQQYSCIKIADYTREVFSNLKHFAVNQYHQLFTELLDYNKPNEPSLALQTKEPNYDILIESVLKAFAVQAWKFLDQSETNSHRMFGAFEREYNRNNRQVEEEREVQPEELEELDAMGFTDQYRSAMALRMANFDTSRAINILFDQQPRLDRYISELEHKQRQKQNKVPVVSDVKMSLDTISIEDFQTNIKAYHKICFDLLLKSTDKTVIDSESALKIIKKLKLQSDLWVQLLDQLKGNPSLHIVKVALLVLQQHKPDKMINFQDLSKVVNSVRLDPESLHFICLFINKTADIKPNFLQEAKELFKDLLTAPDVHQLTKELILATVYQLLSQTKEYEDVQSFIFPNDSKFMLQLNKMALYNPITIETTLKNQINEIFQVQHDYKQQLLKSINKQCEDPLKLAAVNAKELIKFLLCICPDQSIIKNVLVTNCTMRKVNKNVLVKPKDMQFKLHTCEVQPNEKQVFDLLLGEMTVSNLVQASKWTQIFPHLLQLFQRPTYQAFSKTLTGVLFDNQIVDQQLLELLLNLLGYTQFTPNINDRQQIRSALILHLFSCLQEQPLKVLKVIRVLINYNNNFEFNRVLLSPQFYYHNIEFIVTETCLIQSMFGLVTLWTKTNYFEGLQVIFDIIQIFCMHAADQELNYKQDKQDVQMVHKDSEQDEEQGEDMQDEYDQEAYDENDQSSSNYDDEDDHDHSQRGHEQLWRPNENRQEQIIGIRAGGGVDGIFYHPSRLENIRFTNAWTEQENQAQSILQMLYDAQTDQQQDQDPRPFATCFMCGLQGHFARECPNNQDRRPQPPSAKLIKEQQESFANNKMSLKFSCLKPIQKLEVQKILTENVRTMNNLMKDQHKKDAPVYFRTYSRSAESLSRDSFLPFALRQHFNQVIDFGVDDLQERLRQFDTHVTMLMDRSDRDRFFLNSAEEAKDEDPIDLVGNLVGPQQEMSAITESLLAQLPIEAQPNESPHFNGLAPMFPNPFQQSINTLSRSDQAPRLSQFRIPMAARMAQPQIIELPQIQPQNNRSDISHSVSSEENIVDDFEMAQVVQPVQTTFGYPNSVLIENNIDPTLLHDLPEQVRIELLSTVNWQARPIVEVPVEQQPVEEAKEVDLFLDMPQEIRDELALNAQQAAQIQPPVVQQQSDIEEIQTLLASVVDPQIRTEMLIGLSEATVELLPPHLREEARLQRSRQRGYSGMNIRQEMLGMIGRNPFMPPPLPNISNMMQMHWMNDDDRHPQDTIKIDQPKTLEDVEILSLTPDQCYYKLVINQELYVIKSNCSIKDLIEQVDSHSDTPLLTQLLKYLESLATQDTLKVKLNLIPLINSLSAITSKGINKIIECLVEGFSSNFNKSQQQVPCLLFMSILRMFAQMNKQLGLQIISDFLFAANKENNAISVLLKHLQQTQKLDDTTQATFAKNIQTTLQDLLNCHEQIKWDKSKIVPESTIVALTNVFELSVTDQSLVHQIGRLLLKISKQKNSHQSMILELCSNKQQESQKQIVLGLSRVLQQHHNKDEEDDAMSQQSLSLQYQMSQQSQQEAVVKITSEQISSLEENLKSTAKDLTCLRHISQIICIIKPQASEKNKISFKNQIHMLNEVIQIVKNQKQIRPAILSVLKAHISCIFDMNQSELNSIAASFEKSDTEIKMQSLTITQKPSNKIKMASAVFKHVVEVSDQLFEFCKFALINKDMINRMVVIPELFTLSTIVKAMPNILNFDNKRAYFKKEIEKIKKGRPRYSDLSLRVKRKDIFMETYAQLGHKSVEDLKGKLHVNFIGEAGSDLGGLSRDFFVELSRAMFNPNYSLFKLSSNGVTYYPDVHSCVNPNHLNFFRFIGRIVGKALFDGQLLECYFSKPLYKMMVGDELSFDDQKDLDDDAYRGLKWVLTNDIEEQEMYFSVDQDYFGKIDSKELVPGGAEIKVTNANKLEYLDKLGYFKMYTMIQEQVDQFLAGFYELIPKHLVAIFSHNELELLISGLPDFNLADLKANTDYEGYTPESDQVLWLWQILAHASKEEIAKFLQFVTGSSRIPLEGFRALQGNEGIEKFKIKRTFDTLKLPESHTCFNSLDLPEYESKEVMKEKLLFAINETNDFGQL